MRTERVISIYLALVALVTVAQSVTFPVYGYESDGTVASGAIAAWHVLNWFMALGLAAMLSTTYREKRRLDAEASPDLRRWIGASAKFYLTVLLTVAFVPNWLAAIFERGENGLVWYAINTSLPILFILEAIRIRRSATR
ncbi:MAG: hypothetical protein OXD34_13075 [bacterium]|nr:hypothetical protein [bacterium]